MELLQDTVAAGGGISGAQPALEETRQRGASKPHSEAAEEIATIHREVHVGSIHVQGCLVERGSF